MGSTMSKTAIILATIILSSCSHLNLTQETREAQCLEYGHVKGTPAYGECMQKEREMANDFLWGDAD